MSRTNELKSALDERYVTKDYCENKKQRYISKELCEAKESSIRADVEEIKKTCDDIKNNHLAYMQADISEMKVKITIYSGIAAFLAALLSNLLFR